MEQMIYTTWKMSGTKRLTTQNYPKRYVEKSRLNSIDHTFHYRDQQDQSMTTACLIYMTVGVLNGTVITTMHIMVIIQEVAIMDMVAEDLTMIQISEFTSKIWLKLPNGQVSAHKNSFLPC